MVFRSLARTLDKSFSTRGVSGTLWFIVRSTPYLFATFTSSNVLQLKIYIMGKSDFDKQYNIDTEGHIDLHALDIDNPNWKYGIKYQGVDQKMFEVALSSLELDYSKFVFVDIGSGKGRALFLAATKEFLEVTGVEISGELHKVAINNIRSFPDSKKKCGPINSICQDGLSFEFPEKPMVLFLYHPFVEAIMKQFLVNLKSSIENHPRSVYLVYVNDICAATVKKSGFALLTSGQQNGDSWSTYKLSENLLPQKS